MTPRIEKQEEDSTTNIKSEKSGREVRVVKEFNDLLNANPEIVEAFLEINNILKSGQYNEGYQISDINKIVNVEIISRERRRLPGHFKETYCLKVKIHVGDEISDEMSPVFFIKTSPGIWFDPETSMGVEEFEAAEQAKQLLKDWPDVEVVDFMLGFKDIKNHRTIFVSKWINGIRLDEYCEHEKNQKKINEVFRRAREIRCFLEKNGLIDAIYKNMFYDPVEKKFTIFDIHKAK